jgi:hypothetical protein
MLKLRARLAARANLFLCSRREALLDARALLLLVVVGRSRAWAFARRASSPIQPLRQRSSLASTLDLTLEDEAPRSRGPNTKVGNRRRASWVASRRALPRVVLARERRSAITRVRTERVGVGIAAVDWAPEARMHVAVKSWFSTQNWIATDCIRTEFGSNRACELRDGRTVVAPLVVVGINGPSILRGRGRDPSKPSGATGAACYMGI